MPQYPRPRTSEDFEACCLEYLRALWGRPNLVLYGKSGEKQFGIDIIDQDRPLDLHAAQCKLHEDAKTIPPAEIEAEVAKALTFKPDVWCYAICTTAKKSKNAQDAVLEINTRHAETGKFKVVLFFWDDIERFFDQRQDLWERLNVTSAASVRMVVREEFNARTAALLGDLVAGLRSSGDSIDRDLDRVKALLDRHEYGAAEALLGDLRANTWDRLSALQRYRYHVDLSVIEHVNGREAESARVLLEASET